MKNLINKRFSTIQEKYSHSFTTQLTQPTIFLANSYFLDLRKCKSFQNPYKIKFLKLSKLRRLNSMIPLGFLITENLF